VRLVTIDIGSDKKLRLSLSHLIPARTSRNPTISNARHAELAAIWTDAVTRSYSSVVLPVRCPVLSDVARPAYPLYRCLYAGTVQLCWCRSHDNPHVSNVPPTFPSTQPSRMEEPPPPPAFLAHPSLARTP